MVSPTLLNYRYKVIRVLASGGFGETFLAVDTQMPSIEQLGIIFQFHIKIIKNYIQMGSIHSLIGGHKYHK